MTEPIWINGAIVAGEEALIPVQDRGFLLGEGLFETMWLQHGRLWKPDYHAARLAGGLAGLGIPLAPEQLDLPAMAGALAGIRGWDCGILRLNVSAGAGGRGLSPALTAWPLVMATLHPVPEAPNRPIRAVTVGVRRDPLDPAVGWKTLSWLPQVLARRQAQAAGVEEGLMCNTGGEPCCFASGNLLLWDGERLRSPGPGSGALPGTTLAWLADRGMAGYPLDTRPLSHKDLEVARGIFLLNTVRGIVAVDQWDGRNYPSGALPVFGDLSRFLIGERDRECRSGGE
jgi:branched-chain amino acid aminotransferase